MAIKMIGTVNGRVKSVAWSGKVSFEFDGTTLGLVKSVVARGLVGKTVYANYGGTSKDKTQARKQKIVFVGHHETRTGGYWTES